MDEELQKRNTDCVYFLASPLTCKKGIDCEYRHCEIARLNPRDCWYWLSGSCFNPTCAFRHPPLDVHTGAASESVPSSVPVNKTNVPCYFYFNGFCNKGDRCCFLHDINADAAPGGKLVETALANSEVPNLEKDTLAVRESGSAPSNKPSIQQQTNKPFKPPATVKAEADTTVQHKEDFQLSEPEDVSEQSGSSPISVSVCEETATIRSDSFAAGEFVHSISYACEELSSEEQVDERIVPEERWESSPGFDVLVDDDSENLDSEDDPENILTLERGRRDLNSHLFGYDFENQVEYDSGYPGMEIQYESEAYRSYNHPVSEDIFGDVRRNIAGHGEVRMFDSILSCKRKLIPMELALDNHHRDVDLRDRLKRRQFVDGDPLTGLSRIHESNQLIGRSLKRPWQHGMARPRERSTSDIGRSASDNGTFSKGRGQHGFPRHSQKYQPRRHYKEKRPPRRHFLSSEVSSKRLPKVPGERSTRGSSSFSGPKTLTQIKEEKRRPEKDGVSTRKKGSYSRKSSVDFQGPKPLSEILKNKGKLTHESEGNT